ncbi:MAG: glycoside hydrolase family 3 protein [Armatimonadetes bacterium]|nr:glycoside hydrolase family 3 protein [Armatimonadota bacterium]
MATDEGLPGYLNPARSARERAEDLVARMTVEEKVSQLVHEAAAVERLGIPAYNWWNECLHGVGRAGIATVFPQAIGLAATWNTDLMRRVAVAISDEARAKHHAALGPDGASEWYFGLTFWSPNINIFRDPRWGRGQETYGEDPYLTARMGVEFVRGLQGDNPRHLKLVATPKHYAVHSGPEKDRHGFDAQVSQRDLRETYLPAFRACVQEAGAVSIMSAYNRTNGEVCSASPTLLQKILRDEWGFDGYVVSDCGAIDDIVSGHQIVETADAAAALAVRAGCDLNCGCTYKALTIAVQRGLAAEADLDRCLHRLFEARIRLGMFDPPEEVSHAQIPLSVNDCVEHRELAVEAARQSVVLLKNEGRLLPLGAGASSLAVIGPNADDVEVLLGNYNGTPSRAVTPLDGIRARAGEAVTVTHVPGCGLVEAIEGGITEARAAAAAADVAVLVLGLSPRLEGEEGETNLIDKSGDRVDLGLPEAQERLLREVAAVGKPVVLVALSGSAVAIPWAREHVGAIVATWYEEAGTALAEVLFGDVSPAGRLPVTVYESVEDLPPFESYDMADRTYRFFRGTPLFPFGYGLSYTRFEYRNLRITPTTATAEGQVEVSVEVTNVGERAGDEVVQLYVTDAEASVPVPIRQLQGFRRVRLEPGATKTVAFRLQPSQLVCYADDGTSMVEPGRFLISVGGGQPIPGGSAAECLTGELEVTG